MKSKKHYAKQYDMTPQLVGKKGNRIKYEVTYKGDYYRYDVSDEKLLRIRILFLAAAVVCAALFVTAGLLDTTGNRRMWVSIPYVCMFLPVAMMVYAAIKQFFARREMTEKERDSVVGDLKTATVGLMVTSALTAAGTLVFLLTEQVFETAKELAFLGLALFMFIIAFAMWRYQRSIPIITIKQQPLEED